LCLLIGEDEKLSEVDSDDPIEDDDNVSTSAKKSKRTTKKLTKTAKRGSLNKSKKK